LVFGLVGFAWDFSFVLKHRRKI